MSATDGSEDMLKKVAAMTHATETPITDRNVTGPDDKWVDAEIARDLERRLAAAEAELQVAQRKLEKYRLRTDESALQSAWGEAREALRLAKQWIEHDEGKSLQEIIAIEARGNERRFEGRQRPYRWRPARKHS